MSVDCRLLVTLCVTFTLHKPGTRSRHALQSRRGIRDNVKCGPEPGPGPGSIMDLDLLLLVAVIVCFLQPSSGSTSCPTFCRCQSSTVACQLEAVNLTKIFGNLTVETLDLSGNNLKTSPLFPRGLNLTTLDLSSNRIQNLGEAPFENLPTLRTLNLRNNLLRNLTSSSFTSLDGLKSLDVSSNNLTQITGEVFMRLNSLEYLNLSRNRIETLEDNCFNRLEHLQSLDVSHNQLTNVKPNALQALPSLARLNLGGNPHLGDLFVGTGRRLQAVDASKTGLTHIPGALTRSVRTLRLSGNAIHAIQAGDLDSYPLLQFLDFGGNGLTWIEEDALGRLEILTVLYLNENALTGIPKSLPGSLKDLYLERNRISKVTKEDFEGLDLEVLVLSDNDVVQLEGPIFEGLGSLRTLDLSGNPLVILGTPFLGTPIRLEHLHLAGLPMTLTGSNDLGFPIHDLDHLVTLDLTASPALVRMLLADEAALVRLRSLQELSLADAGLIHLRKDLLEFAPQLRTLKLMGNRLDCTELEWLAVWMRRNGNRNEDREVICAGPSDLMGTLVIDLQTEETSQKALGSQRPEGAKNLRSQFKEIQSKDLENHENHDIGNMTLETTSEPENITEDPEKSTSVQVFFGSTSPGFLDPETDPSTLIPEPVESFEVSNITAHVIMLHGSEAGPLGLGLIQERDPHPGVFIVIAAIFLMLLIAVTFIGVAHFKRSRRVADPADPVDPLDLSTIGQQQYTELW